MSSRPTGGAGAWSRASIDSPQQLTGISCPSISFCVAVDLGQDVITSLNPTGGAGAWTAARADTGNGSARNLHARRITPADLAAVSCPSSSLCVAVDDGNVMTSSDPGVARADGRPSTSTLHTASLRLDRLSGPVRVHGLCVPFVVRRRGQLR